MTITVTPNAIARIQTLTQQENNPSLMFRIEVLPCRFSGFQYHFQLDANATSDDEIFTFDVVKIVIDNISIGLLNDALLDYEEDLAGAAFVIKNPHAASSCGCGQSFSL